MVVLLRVRPRVLPLAVGQGRVHRLHHLLATATHRHLLRDAEPVVVRVDASRGPVVTAPLLLAWVVVSVARQVLIVRLALLIVLRRLRSTTKTTQGETLDLNRAALAERIRGCVSGG